MKRIPLRSKRGCRKCRERRRKCDEQRPICGECLRLGSRCLWVVSSISGSENKRPLKQLKNIVEVVNTEETKLIRFFAHGPSDEARRKGVFDHPSVLKASATSSVETLIEKHVLQYLFEQGHQILQYPLRHVPISINVNAFRRGYPMAITAPRPIQVQALLCLGAAYLSKVNSRYMAMSLQQYNITMSSFRDVLNDQGPDFPAEWICAVAAILSYYQMLVFHSPESRLAHLVGFHTLVDTRIKKSLTWSRGRVLLEHHIHSLSINSLFHHDEILSRRSLGDIDYLLDVLNSEERPLGREIVGVPEDMTVAIYKLSFLNTKVTSISPWTFELSAIEGKTKHWKPQTDTPTSSAKSLLLLAKLYHLACLCLVQYLWSRDDASVDLDTFEHVNAASMLIKDSDLVRRPVNSAAWPLTILAIFARDTNHRFELLRPLQSLADRARLEGYRSVLRFVGRVWENELGPTVFQRSEILAMVHL